MTTASGILLIDKPAGITSHDAVSRTRKIADTRKVGHAGTLDPMATGLLVLGINSSTRLLTFVVGLDKEYLATIRLGASTVTDDREGDLLESAPDGAVAAIGSEAILGHIAELTGEIEQVPSAVSAIKVDGKRAYALVRAGESVELRSRAVTVSSFEVLESRLVEDDGSTFLDLDVRVECSSGTYIRALARDLGSALGVGGHLTALRRTRIGPFLTADASDLEHLDVGSALLGPAVVATTLFPHVDLDAQQVVDLTHGKRLAFPDAPTELRSGPVAALGPDGRLVGLLSIDGSKGRPIVNFPTDEVLA